MNTDNFNDFFGSEPATGPAKSRTSEPKELPTTLGRYRVTSYLGGGGFGDVYAAFDDDLHRPVAIKVPKRKFATTGKNDGFSLEARVLAQLDHVNIVPVFDIARMDDGRLLIVSKYIEGSDLKKKLESSRVHIGEACRLTAAIADALHYAHLQGLVHRDIKPANILLDQSGRVYLADFGLALREEDFGKGATGAGTVPYMSPEQARSEGHRVDGRSDIFSLGTVFYEMLTGRRPFISQSLVDLLDQIIDTEPRPPRQIDDSIPKEVERICLKAMSKQASQRYTTAKDMAEDVQAFLDSQKASNWPTPLRMPAAPVAVPISTPVTPASSHHDVVVVPKGLRSFEAGDADFFTELLPGPRDRDGLPDSIRRWRERIIRTEADDTFAVGLIYGPSGCGKSSLVKAGLLPRLPDTVIPIYIEAAPELTEERLLARIRRQCPALPERPLDESIAMIRRGVVLDPGKKILIVIDQFEQWLYAHQGDAATELVRTLRQCDGGRVQCLLLVRDDFWMAVTRLMRELEINIADDSNAAGVDLFDTRHAKKVLTMLGRAHNALPAGTAELSADQQRFIDQAVEGLSQNGKLIPVRLALFSEMVKGRQWTPATLKAIGGMEGVGVTFLEESFSAASAPPQHRLHDTAARAVLQALLPAPGKDIKGNMRSHRELLEASGYAGKPRDFDDLLRILHRELRLVSPADLEGVTADSSSGTPKSANEHYYQLTHDYLVPALRDWLTRKQRETRKGRAELLLAEQAEVWSGRRDKRQLPTFWQWANIGMLTDKLKWSDNQKRMMKKAGRHHVRRSAVVLCTILLASLVSWAWFRDHHAKSLVHRLLDNDTASAAETIQEMAPYGQQVVPLLQAALLREADNDTPRRLRARMGLLPFDSGQRDHVLAWLLKCEAGDFPAILKVLENHKAAIAEKLWAELKDDTKQSQARFQSACALANLVRIDDNWANESEFVASTLVAQPKPVRDIWLKQLEPAKARLFKPLAKILAQDDRSDEDRSIAAQLFELLAAGDDAAIASLSDELRDQLPLTGSREDRLKFGSRRANIGLALFQMGCYTQAETLFQITPDPTARTFLIHRMNPRRIPAARIIARLNDPKIVLTPEVRYCLLLALGEYGTDRMTASDLAACKSMLFKLYRDEPDAGVHGAAEWLARRHLGFDQQMQPIDSELQPRDASLLTSGQQPPGNRRWYVNSLGMTMVTVDSGKFWTGENATLQNALLSRRIAISATAVTVSQFHQMMREHKHTTELCSSDECPINTISWYEAAEFCNRLSQRESISNDQLCYEPKGGIFGPGMNIVPVTRNHVGYRMPTVFEYDMAIRAGSKTTYSFGESDPMTDKYAWHDGNSRGKSQSGGLLRPNLFGIFDAHGNMPTWCQGLQVDDGTEAKVVLLEPEDIRTVLEPDPKKPMATQLAKFRTIRGGAFDGSYGNIRSSASNTTAPSGLFMSPNKVQSVGLRLVRTMP